MMEQKKRIERNHYNKKAELLIKGDYLNFNWQSGSEGFGPVFSLPLRFIEEKIKNIFIEKKKKITFLDYGCGIGINSIFPAKLGAKVYGIDISEKSLAIAREWVKREEVENKVEFLFMDCESLDFPDNFFDIVFNCGTLSCLDRQRAYAEITRVLKPDGYFLSVDTLGHNPFGNLSRRMKLRQGLRTKQTFNNVLKIKDITIAKQYFKKTEVYFFALSTLLAIPFQKLPGVGVMIKFLDIIDKILFKLPILRKYAFKVVFIFSQPKKNYVKEIV